MYEIGKFGAYSTKRYTGETVLVTFYDLRKVGQHKPFTIVHRNYRHAEVRVGYLIEKGEVVKTGGQR